MNSRYIFLLFGILVLLPLVSNDVFAHHVERDSGGNYDDLFYYQEIDDTTGVCSSAGYVSGSGFQITTSTGASSRYCIFFKVFDANDINGHTITLNQGVWSRTNGVADYAYMRIYDGEYVAGDPTDFPTDSFIPTKGNGLLYNSGGTTPAPTNPATPSFTASEDKVTVMFGFLQDDTGAGSTAFYMERLTISGVGTWNICNVGTTFCNIVRPVNVGQSGTELDWGYVSSYDTMDVWVKGADVTDLAPTVLNSTAVQFDWSEIDDAGIGIQNVTNGLNVTGYMMEYKNGTSNQSDYWTLLSDSIGDVETYTSNVFEAGHSYTARIITKGYDGNWLSEPSNEVTFTMSGTSSTTETYDEAYYRNSDDVDNRFYYREMSGNGMFSSIPDRIGFCTVHNYFATPSSGYQIGTSNGGTGNCIGFLKRLPASEVMDVPWTLTHSYHRSADATYHTMKILDGDFSNIYNSTIFQHYGDWLKDRTEDGTILYSFGTTTPSPSSLSSFTPTGATEDWVTFFIEYTDETANDVYSTMQKLSIFGYETFYFANTAGLQTTYPDTQYIDGTEHDWGWVDALFPPKIPVLTVTASGDDDALLTWTNPSLTEPFTSFPTSYTIHKECPSGGGWKSFVADTGSTDLTYTDVGFLEAIIGDYEETFDDDVYQSSWTSTDDETPNYVTYHSATDVLKFSMLSDAVDKHITFPLSTEGVGITSMSNSTWVMEFKLHWNDITTGTGQNYWIFGLGSVDANVYDTAMDFIGLHIRVDAGGATSSIFTIYRDGASRTETDTTYNFNNASDEGQDFYVKISRTSTTNMNVKVYDGAVEDMDNLRVNYDKSIPSTIINLDKIIMSNYGSISVASETLLDGEVDNLKIGDGVLNLQGVSTECNYRVYANSDLGVSQYSNESSLSQSGVSLTSPESLVCGTQGQDSINLTWDYNGVETPTGYRIEMETPIGGGFTTVVANTGNTQTTKLINGLASGITYNFKVAVLVGEDTSGFSNTRSCVTQSSGGGSGSSTTTTTSETPTTPTTPTTGTEFQTQTPSNPLGAGAGEAFDNAFPLIQELTDTFSGDIFTLIGARHTVGLGQTIDSNMLIGWNTDKNLLINTIIIAPSQVTITPQPLPPYYAEGGSKLNEKEITSLSITPPVSEKLVSHQLLPLSIQIPDKFCGSGITTDCIEEGTHKIPVKVITTKEGVNVASTARIEITVGSPTINFDIPTFVLIAIIAVGAIGAYQVNKNFSKKKSGVHVA